MTENNINKEDWVECELGKVFETVTGNTPPRKDPENYGSDIPFIKPPHIQNNLITTSDEFLSLKGVKKGRVLPVDSVLVTCIGNLGRIGITRNKVAFNQQINAIKPIKQILPKFVFYQTQSLKFKNELEKLSTSTTVKLVNKTSFNTIKFTIAPLPIQTAIVKKIEELFSSLDSGIADLKKAQEQLKVYRQAVLKKAFEGDWEITTIGEIFDFKGGGTPSKKESRFWNGEIPWASVKDIKGDILNKTQDFITKEGLENSSSNLALKGHVILITRISPGKTIITNIDVAINQDLKIVTPKVDMINKFSHYLLKSIEGKVLKLSSGTTVKGINLNNLNSIEIPNIKIEEQHKIVKEIESRLSVCDAVEQNIIESLEKAESLRQSILKQAFDGKLLTAEEIQKCKEQPDYEPASVLLERIKDEL